jgi:hypothetical protein
VTGIGTVVAVVGLAGIPAAAAAVLAVLIVTAAVCWAVADEDRAGRLAAVLRAARGRGGNA